MRNQKLDNNIINYMGFAEKEAQFQRLKNRNLLSRITIGTIVMG